MQADRTFHRVRKVILKAHVLALKVVEAVEDGRKLKMLERKRQKKLNWTRCKYWLTVESHRYEFMNPTAHRTCFIGLTQFGGSFASLFPLWSRTVGNNVYCLSIAAAGVSFLIIGLIIDFVIFTIEWVV